MTEALTHDEDYQRSALRHDARPHELLGKTRLRRGGVSTPNFSSAAPARPCKESDALFRCKSSKGPRRGWRRSSRRRSGREGPWRSTTGEFRHAVGGWPPSTYLRLQDFPRRFIEAARPKGPVQNHLFAIVWLRFGGHSIDELGARTTTPKLAVCCCVRKFWRCHLHEAVYSCTVQCYESVFALSGLDAAKRVCTRLDEQCWQVCARHTAGCHTCPAPFGGPFVPEPRLCRGTLQYPAPGQASSTYPRRFADEHQYHRWLCCRGFGRR